MSYADPICCHESEDITWFRRTCTRAEARRFCENEWGRFDLIVRQCHIRELQAGDCPAHPNEDDGGGEWQDGCRCYEIEEGWRDECTHRDEGAVPAWRVEPASSTGQEAKVSEPSITAVEPWEDRPDDTGLVPEARPSVRCGACGNEWRGSPGDSRQAPSLCACGGRMAIPFEAEAEVAGQEESGG